MEHGTVSKTFIPSEGREEGLSMSVTDTHEATFVCSHVNNTYLQCSDWAFLSLCYVHTNGKFGSLQYTPEPLTAKKLKDGINCNRLHAIISTKFCEILPFIQYANSIVFVSYQATL
jgi:hypothetical protein